MTSRLPIDLTRIIADYAAIWTILPWVRAIENTIKIWPESFDRTNVKIYQLSRNPMAMDEIESQKTMCPSQVAANCADWAFDMIESKISHHELDVSHFLTNTNPRAIAYIEKNIETLTSDYWSVLLKNSGAIELIKKYNGIEKASQPWNIYENSNESTCELIDNHNRTTIIVVKLTIDTICHAIHHHGQHVF